MNASDAAVCAGEGPDWIGALIDSGVRVHAASGGWASALGAVQSRPGVVALEDGEGRTVLMGATADARAFAASRLGGGRGAGAVDLNAAVTRVHVVGVASAFEGDLVFLRLARQRMPDVYRKLMERWAVGVVRLDPRDEFPDATALRLADAAAERPGVLLGPVAWKSLPRLAESVVDAFDLCRYPHILKQAPRGAACVYKEMGRCPAPCDGTEAMESYRSRVLAAVERVGLPPAARTAELAEEMKRAAGASRFEEAAALRRVIDRVDELGAPALRGACTMDRFRYAIVAHAGSPRSVRVFICVGGRLVKVEDGGTEGSVGALLSAALAEPVTMPRSHAEIEALTVVARWASSSGSRRRIQAIRIDRPEAAPEVMRAVRSLARGKEADDEGDFEETEHLGGG